MNKGSLIYADIRKYEKGSERRCKLADCSLKHGTPSGTVTQEMITLTFLVFTTLILHSLTPLFAYLGHVLTGAADGLSTVIVHVRVFLTTTVLGDIN